MHVEAVALAMKSNPFRLHNAILYLWIALISAQVCKGVKITMLSGVGHSHYLSTEIFARELSRRGHQVTICSPESTWITEAQNSDHPARIIAIPFNMTKFDILTKKAASPEYKGFFGQFALLDEIQSHEHTTCDSLMKTPETIQAIIDADLVIAEISMDCPGLIMKKLGKRWIGLSPFNLPELISYIHGVALNPSVTFVTFNLFKDRVTFFQRLQNYILHTAILVMNRYSSQLTDFKLKHNMPDDQTLWSLGEAEIIISNCDFSISYPYPHMPNYFCVGSLTSNPAKELTSPFKEYLEDSQNGVIFVSFGTTFDDITREQIATMASVFGRLKQNVIWKIKDTKGVQMPSNVRIVRWAPQNDLLGSPRLSLFISHVGQSSLMETCYHGIPVLAVPKCLDQVLNAHVASHRLKIGETLDLEVATEEDWYSKIQTVLKNESYRINARRVSSLMRTRKQHPLQFAGDLVQYVIDNNYDMSHLKSGGNDLLWYEYYLVDVKAFLVFISGLILFVLCRGIQFLVGRMLRGKMKKD